MIDFPNYYRVISLDAPRPAKVLGAISQMTLRKEDFDRSRGFFELTRVEKVERKLESLLSSIQRDSPKIVALPELSIPYSATTTLREYSKVHEAVVVAGTHYDTSGDQVYSRCPVFICGEEYFVEKLFPSPLQASYIEHERVRPGRQSAIFKNTPIGDFAVLICSDFLQDELLGFIRRQDLDFLIVPSCQRESSRYFSRMANFVRECKDGAYVLFPNLILDSSDAAKSGCVAVVDDIYLTSAVGRGLTDLQPKQKIWEATTPNDFLLARFDIDHKKPDISKSTEAEPNVIVLRTRKLDSAQRVATEGARFKLVAFDLDGTLLRGARFSWVHVWESIGDHEGKKWRALMQQYLRGELSYAEWCSAAADEFRRAGVDLIHLRRVAQKLRVTRGLSDGVEALRKAGFALGIVSGGIDVFLHELIPDYERMFDFVYINRLNFRSNGELASVDPTDYDFEGKLAAVELEGDDRNISLQESVFVGDQFNDEAVLKKVGHAILYTSTPDSAQFGVHHSMIEDDFVKLARHIIALNEKPKQGEIFGEQV